MIDANDDDLDNLCEACGCGPDECLCELVPTDNEDDAADADGDADG